MVGANPHTWNEYVGLTQKRTHSVPMLFFKMIQLAYNGLNITFTC